MHIVALGLSYKTTPVETRGRVAWTADQTPGALSALRAVPGVREGAILSTCNRTEIYAVLDKRLHGRDVLLDLWSREKGVPLADLANHYYYVGNEAVSHLMRVASGLDSMILGETQILGQVKDSYELARDRAAVGKVLHALFSQALACGKRVHTETGISQNAVSVSYAAVELARKIFGELRGRSVLLVGAGKMAGLTARHLADGGVREILVANRTVARAEEMAAGFGGRAVPMEALEAHLGVADVVISSTGAPGVVITREMVQRAMRARRSRPLFLVDIAVPSDVDPAAGGLDNVFLYNIDDLQAVVLANLEERAREAQKAERIVAEEAARFQAWLRTLEAVPLIRSLREKAEEIRDAELRRLFNRLPALSERDRELIAASTSLIVNKILNDPTVRVKEFAGEQDADVYLRAFSRLFNLEERNGKAAPPSAGGAAPGAAPAESPAAGSAPAAEGGERRAGGGR